VSAGYYYYYGHYSKYYKPRPEQESEAGDA
jgi:hypothetical protein